MKLRDGYETFQKLIDDKLELILQKVNTLFQGEDNENDLSNENETPQEEFNEEYDLLSIDKSGFGSNQLDFAQNQAFDY